MVWPSINSEEFYKLFINTPFTPVQRRYLGESKPEKSRISTTFDNFVNRQKTPETFEDFLKSVDEDNTKSREQR